MTLWLLGLWLMLFALGGISLDLWRSFSERRALAATADAAAWPGASAIDEARYHETGVVELVPTEAEARARAGIAAQLDRDALRTVDVRADDEAVTVVVHGEVGFTLLGLLHRGAFEVEVAATATPRRSGMRVRARGRVRVRLVVDSRRSGPIALIATVVGGHRGDGSAAATSIAAQSGAGARDLGAGQVPGAGLRARRRRSCPRTSGAANTGATCAVLPGPVPPSIVDAVSPLPASSTSRAFPSPSGPWWARRPARAGRTRHRVAYGVDHRGVVRHRRRDAADNTHLLVVPRLRATGEPLPPDPPTAAEIWNRTPLPRAAVHASPPGTRTWPGIVNLETRFWGAAPGDARAQWRSTGTR